LPRKIITEYFDQKGFLSRCDTVDVNDIKINIAVVDSYFSDFIPEDALVSDAINEMTYKQSDSPSINSLIKETAKSKRIFI
jgi:hypothetical protein